MSEKKRQSTNLNSIESLMERIERGSEDRAKLVNSHVDKGIAYQIRATRERQRLSQEQLAAKVGMNQNSISRIESATRGRPTITTLKRLAAALDVALVVRLEPFSKLIKWVSGTPYIEGGLTTEALAVPNFIEESQKGIFKADAPVQLYNQRIFLTIGGRPEVLNQGGIFSHVAEPAFLSQILWERVGYQIPGDQWVEKSDLRQLVIGKPTPRQQSPLPMSL